MQLITIPDFQGDGYAHRLTDIMLLQGVPVPNPPLARMLVFREVTGGASSTRVGGPDVSPTNGIPLQQDSLVLPPAAIPPPANAIESHAGAYRLDEIYLIAPSTDTISIAFAPF